MNTPSQKLQKGLEKGNISIRNMLASIERTFLPVGSMIGKYRIIEEIDRGGMAVVYKALQLDLDREVALKVMPANITINRSFVERFLTEAHAVARLSHPYIVSIHEVAVENNIYYLVMDYIPGKNLFYHLHFHKPKLVDVIEIIARLAEALSYAHEQKIIHRDLKLNNVIMKDKLTPVLIDFGLAKAMENDDDGGITRTGEIMGSPSYMAPERLVGTRVDHRSDICSLGIMLYEMLTFKNPYLDQRNLHQTTINVMEANPIPLRKLIPWLPVEIEAITLKAMAKDPDQRYQTMGELHDDIRRYQKGEPIIARPPSLVSRITRFFKKHWSAIAICNLLVFFTIFLLMSMYIQNQKEQSHWQLIYNVKSSIKTFQADWFFNNRVSENGDGFRVNNGVMSACTKSMQYARFQRHLNRDVLIEFDIMADSGTLYNAGIFLFGDQPRNGFCFHVNKWPQGSHGLTMPGSSFIIQDAEPAQIPFSSTNHIIIEYYQNLITFKLNGFTVAKVWDFMPPIGKDHDRMGFFVNNGTARFDNLKIYRRATPQVPSPSLIADRFRERGDFESAIDEYQSLLPDLNNNYQLSSEISLKIADCLVRLNKLDEALAVLGNRFLDRSKDEKIIAGKMFLEAIIYNLKKNDQAADEAFKALSTRYPSNPVNVSAMLLALQRSVDHIENNRPDVAEREITALIDQYKKYPNRWGKLYLKLLNYHIEKCNFETAQRIANSIIDKGDLDDNVITNAKIALGQVYLHQGKTEKAKDVFDQCVTGHTNTPGVWEAWYKLAGIYEYDLNYKDARTLYRKIFRECSKSSQYSWMALVKLSELGLNDSIERPQVYLDEATKMDNPFPESKLIAKFFKNELSDSDFKTKWQLLYPDDNNYLYYYARKANASSEQVVSTICLNELKKKTSKLNWDYFRIIKILNNIDMW